MTLAEQCARVLQENWMGSFTIPSKGLYPFQWNWDSGFHALGWVHLDPEKALIEMETLFKSQWKNGFLPHIVFHNYKVHKTYFPSADYWEPWVSPFSNPTVPSSGITQPPIHGWVLEKMHECGVEETRLKQLVIQALEYHTFLHRERSYKDTELLVMYHNWESGMDNSAVWDKVFDAIPKEKYEHITFTRKDIHEVSDSEQMRPRDEDYQRYLYLLQYLKSKKFGTPDSAYPFQIIEPVFNTIYLLSTESLIRLCTTYGINEEWLEEIAFRLRKSINKYLWNVKTQAYLPLNITAKEHIVKRYHGNFFPIIARLQTPEISLRLIENYAQEHLYPFPSIHPEEEGFEEKKYWRGPVWVNINWMIIQGLLDLGMKEKAAWLKSETIEMVKIHGMYEYFSPFKSAKAENGCGGANFSWTAALVLDLLNDARI